MKENQRVRLSKQLLRNSLIDLLKDKNINKISVREICDHAEINRTTFYKYYGSQYDLLLDMENILLTQLEFYLKDGNQDMINIITFIDDNIELCRILLNNNVDPDFPDKILYHPLIKERVSEIITKEHSKTYLEYYHRFLVNGCYNVIKYWLNKANRETPEELCNHLQKLLNHHLYIC